MQGHPLHVSEHLFASNYPGAAYGFFHVTVDLLLRAIGGAHKPIKACELQEQTHQANTTRANLNKDHV